LFLHFRKHHNLSQLGSSSRSGGKSGELFEKKKKKKKNLGAVRGLLQSEAADRVCMLELLLCGRPE
jgi:hypothetical protein